MSGLTIMVDGIYQNTLGQITLVTKADIESLSILGEDTVNGASQYSIVYNPQDTDNDQKGVLWGLFSDSSCTTPLSTSVATLTSAGLLSVINTGLSGKIVYIKATSTFNAGITSVKEVFLSATSVVNNKEIKMLINVPTNNYTATLVFDNNIGILTDIDFGDGTTSPAIVDGAALKHIYALAGDYNVIIRKSNDIVNLGNSTLANVRVKTMTLPASINNIGNYCLYNNPVAQSLLLFSTIPPTLVANALNTSNYTFIYVPDESVNAYKAAAVWSGFSAKIKGLSEY